jgi:serine/threonine protein kinase
LTAALSGPRYQTRQLHRQGGLGAVWLARDTLLGRDVALKSIRPDRDATPEDMARFIHEARVTSQLEHPCIVPLYDWLPGDAAAGGSEPHGPRYVMRFVSGRTLSETAADYHKKRVAGIATRLDLANLLDAFVAVCRAVEYAHSRGILHRDLKGVNVVLGRFGEVFLVDWGLAKSGADQAAAAPDTRAGVKATSADVQTVDGAVVGTPAYVAPEVAAAKPATQRSDVYGLGAILYEILADRAPYAGKSAAEIVTRVATEEPVSVHSANPSAPAALEAVCKKAMARDPAKRYASAEEVATDVRRWLADEPVSAYSEPWLQRAARWARRHRTPVIAAAVLLVTAAVASSIAAVLVWREQQQTRLEQRNAEQNADAAIEVVRNLSNYVEAYEVGANRAPGKRWETLGPALASYERLLELHPEDPSVRLNVAQMHRMKANLSRFLDKFDDAEQSYHEAIRLFGQLVEDYPDNSTYREVGALTMQDFGQFLQRLGRYPEAARMVDETIRLYEELFRTHPEEPKYQRQVALLHMSLADRELQVGRLAEAEQAARRSAALYAQLADKPGANPDPIDTLFHAMAEHNLAVVLREQGRKDEALAAHESAVQRMAGMIKVTNSRDAWSFYHRVRTERAWTLGHVFGQAKDAIAELESAIAGWDKLIKQLKENPVDLQRTGVARYYCGRLRAQSGQRDTALKDLTVAAHIQEGLVEKQAQVPLYRYDLGRTYTALGQLDNEPQAAANWYRKAREMLDAAVQRYPENFLHRQAQKELNTLYPANP